MRDRPAGRSWTSRARSACSGTRYGPDQAADARSWLTGLALLPLNEEVLDIATTLDPTGLRSLDALHLATALAVRDDIGILISYDERLTEAAVRHGLPVSAPR
ncbi:MAG: PIN domain-containing protein [Thermoleophilaceae bacterium]